MALTRFRDPDTGRFVSFEQGAKLQRELYPAFGDTRISFTTARIQRAREGFTGIRATEGGRRVAIAPGQSYDRGKVYVDGVPIFNLKYNTFIKDFQIKDIKAFIADLKRQRPGMTKAEYRQYVDDFIEELYPENYKEIKGGRFENENILIDLQAPFYHAAQGWQSVLKQSVFKDKSFPVKFAAADTETAPEGHAVIFSIAGIDRTGTYTEKAIRNSNWLVLKDEIEAILRRFKVVYFHNLEYDLNAIFKTQWLEEYKTIFRPNGCLICRIQWTKKLTTTLIDSYAILNNSLKNIGKIIGHEKTEVKGNYLDVEYCLNDSILLYRALCKTFETMKKESIPFAYTLPSIFIKTLQTSIDHKIYRLDREPCEFIRKAYKGGRNEVFVMGKHEHINVYDINSLYPYIMQSERLAIPGYAEAGDKLRSPDDCFQVVMCKVKIWADPPPLGIKFNGNLIFPVGTFVGYFTNKELQYVTSNRFGKVIRIYKTLDFEYYPENDLKPVVERLYNLRRRAKTDFERFFFKIILNGGYGKFGQWLFKTEYNRETKLLEMIETDELKPFANQVWAVQITAGARQYLHEFMMKYRKNLIYVDTDSLHMTGTLPKKLLSTTRLGAFKLETSGPAEYKACKFYKIGNKYKVKGVPKKEIDPATGHEINLQKIAFDNNVVTVKRPVKIKTALRQGKNVNVWVPTEKKFKLTYEKRAVNDDLTTKPVELNLDIDFIAKITYFPDEITEDEVATQQEQYEKLYGGRREAIATHRNRCRTCGVFISDFECFCEKHNPENPYLT